MVNDLRVFTYGNCVFLLLIFYKSWYSYFFILLQECLKWLTLMSLSSVFSYAFRVFMSMVSWINCFGIWP